MSYCHVPPHLNSCTIVIGATKKTSNYVAPHHFFVLYSHPICKSNITQKKVVLYCPSIFNRSNAPLDLNQYSYVDDAAPRVIACWPCQLNFVPLEIHFPYHMAKWALQFLQFHPFH